MPDGWDAAVLLAGTLCLEMALEFTAFGVVRGEPQTWLGYQHLLIYILVSSILALALVKLISIRGGAGQTGAEPASAWHMCG